MWYLLFWLLGQGEEMPLGNYWKPAAKDHWPKASQTTQNRGWEELQANTVRVVKAPGDLMGAGSFTLFLEVKLGKKRLKISGKSQGLSEDPFLASLGLCEGCMARQNASSLPLVPTLFLCSVSVAGCPWPVHLIT